MRGALSGWLGDFSDAAICFQRLTVLTPENFQAHYNLGLALAQQGKTAEAIACYDKALSITPSSVEAHANRAICLHQLGRLTEAEAAYQTALNINPNLPQLRVGLAGVLNGQQRYAEAIDCIQNALKSVPTLAEAWYQMGFALAGSGLEDKAVDAHRQALGINPTLIEAHAALAALFRKQGNLDQAISHLNAVLRQKPDHFDALFELGNLWQIRGKAQQALICYERCLVMQCRRPEIHYNLGLVQEILGDHDKAIAHYKNALAIKPDYEEALAGILHEMEKQHRFDEALNLLESHEPAPQMRSARLASCCADIYRHFGRQQDARRLLEKNLETADTHDADRYLAHFNLGHLYDQAGEYDQAFMQFRRANTLTSYPFKIENFRSFINHCMECFSETAISLLPRTSLFSDRPVFIVGMPRSGTSLTEQILASHPSVFGAGELRDMQQIVDGLPVLPKNQGAASPYSGIKKLSTATLDGMAQRYLMALDRLSPTALRVTDKMPHNFLHLGLIQLLFPRARVIHCRRHPIDTCLSIYFQHFNANHAYSTSLKALGLYYREYERLMEHWRKVLQLPYLEIHYEDLVNDPETKSRAMIEFCDLNWDENCLRFHETRRVVNTPSYGQVRQPLYRKSLERWRHYEKHIGELIDVLGPT